MFKNLQAKFDGRTEVPIEIQEICDALIDMGYQDDIRIVPEDMNTSELLGAYVQFTEQPNGPYSDPKLVSLIVYPNELDGPNQRVVCAKELVHVCDAAVSQTRDPDEILALAKVLTGGAEIGAEPQMTMKVAADILAQQKGLMLLFPRAARLIARQKIADRQLTVADLSDKLQLPASTVEDMLEDEWDAIADAIANVAT